MYVSTGSHRHLFVFYMLGFLAGKYYNERKGMYVMMVQSGREKATLYKKYRISWTIWRTRSWDAISINGSECFRFVCAPTVAILLCSLANFDWSSLLRAGYFIASVQLIHLCLFLPASVFPSSSVWLIDFEFESHFERLWTGAIMGSL